MKNIYLYIETFKALFIVSQTNMEKNKKDSLEDTRILKSFLKHLLLVSTKDQFLINK